MSRKFEHLPNEILLEIFSNLSWSNLLTSFWLLNQRLNILIYSIFKKHDHFIDFQSDVSFHKYNSILFPIQFNILLLMIDIQTVLI